MRRILLILAALFIGPTAVHADDAEQAWIAVTQEDGFARLEIFARLDGSEKGSYELVAIKEGTSGRSVNRQAGSVPPSNGEAVGPISVSRFSVEPGATLEVALKVTDQSGKVYEDEVSLVGD